MQIIKKRLQKRRYIALIVIWIVALSASIFDYFYGFVPTTYISAEYRFYALYFLIFYKIVEIYILYIFLYKKNRDNLFSSNFNQDMLNKFEKRAKQTLFLIPQGSIVFGIIAYKITGIVWFVYLFVLVASVVLLLIKPKNL
jgi:hypothetical protein